jgi:hypothetical protein
MTTERAKPQTGGGGLLALTVLAGACFLSIDLAWRGSAVTPVLALCWMMAVSIRRRRPTYMKPMVAILLVFVVASLWPHGWDRVAVRSISFLVGSSLALLHAGSLERADRLIELLKQVVKRAPTALMTADSMGYILSASREFEELVGEEYRPLEGQCLSDVLMGQTLPGEAMRQYIEWFRRDGMHEQEFMLRGHPDMRFQGKVACSGEGRDRLLIVSLGQGNAQGGKA